MKSEIPVACPALERLRQPLGSGLRSSLSVCAREPGRAVAHWQVRPPPENLNSEQSFRCAHRVDRCRCIEGRCLHQIMSAKTNLKVTKTKTALKQITYNLSNLKHDLHCGFVELGGSVSVSFVTSTIDSKTF